MRVLHIFNEVNFSGAEIMYAAAAPLFREKGVEMIALSTGPEQGNYTAQFEDAGITVLHRPFRPRTLNPVFLMKYMRGIRSLIREQHIDVIHVHRSNVFWFFSLCGFLSRKRTVMTLHNVFTAKRYSWLLHYLTRLTARKCFGLRFQSIGESVRNNERHFFHNPTLLINNWYDTSRFYPARDEAEKRSVRKKIGAPADAFIIVTAGRCTAVKNHADIVKAMSALRPSSDFVFLHLGGGHLEQSEKELAGQLGLDAQVHFLGNQVNVREYMIASDVFVMTSRFEGAAIAAIEAMACGLPNILYNSPGLRDLITNDDNGLLIEPGYDRLAEGVIRLRNDTSLRTEKGNHALQYARTKHSMENSVEQITEFYKS